MSIDLDKYHCPRCEAMCGPSISEYIEIIFFFLLFSLYSLISNKFPIILTMIVL